MNNTYLFLCSSISSTLKPFQRRSKQNSAFSMNAMQYFKKLSLYKLCFIIWLCILYFILFNWYLHLSIAQYKKNLRYFYWKRRQSHFQCILLSSKCGFFFNQKIMFFMKVWSFSTLIYLYLRLLRWIRVLVGL